MDLRTLFIINCSKSGCNFGRVEAPQIWGTTRSHTSFPNTMAPVSSANRGFAGACRELLGLLLHPQLNRTLIWGSDSRQRRDDAAWDGRGVGFKRHCQTH
ncbi:uncharacterized protein CLUP02_05871 [Colletotrichum lupini]|uniref:Uncharacterized protein n=1 Tax=Colletotrichum lupini TaxID=145971 RepID=A0A9Q8SNK4_9PEZI|nr:uncharacterized protein CLUP02_05871 [Colletotrichum lupini]UQC80388.1 hypothetical protein CLUP02_05871 [Colletotrichum lupini]